MGEGNTFIFFEGDLNKIWGFILMRGRGSTLTF
jgi:hypothetical protein